MAGAIEHYREFLIGRDPMQIGAHLAGDVSQPVFRGRARAAGGDFGHRHRPARHQGQGARRAGLRAARRQAARPHPHLRLDRRRGRGRCCHRTSPRTARTGLAGDPLLPRRAKQQGHLRAARVDRRDRAHAEQGARGAGRRRRPRHRLSPSPVGRRGGELLPTSSAAARSISSRSRSATRRRRPTSRCAR